MPNPNSAGAAIVNRAGVTFEANCLLMAQAIQNFPLLFLIAIALIPRLYNINSPIIGVHAWRQADTAAIARNFYETQLAHPGLADLWRLFYPQVDWGGGGYAETEFPIYPAIVSGLYRLVGDHTACARLVSVFFSLLGLYFLYRLVALCFDQSVAFWSALLYAILPLSVFYSRTVQPESLVMMSTLGGLYFFNRWTVQADKWDLLWSWGFSAIASLTKVLPLVYLGIPLLFLAVVKYRWRVVRRWDLWIYAIALLGVTFAWYAHAHQIYLETGLTFGFWSNDTDRYSWADLRSVKYWTDILFRLLVRHFAIFSFIVALLGLTYKRHQLEDYLWEMGLISSWCANALAPTSSYIHEYYQLPIMLYGLVFAGKVCAQAFTAKPDTLLRSRFRRAIQAALALTFITSSLIYSLDYMQLERPQTSKVLQLAQLIEANTPPEAKVLATTGGDPSLLYLSHRQGWLIHPEDVSIERIRSAKRDGADFWVGSYEIVQSYAPFEDDSQKNNIRQILSQSAAACPPVINNQQVFISAICP